MAKNRARRDEPSPRPDQLVLRGLLGDTGLDPSDLRQTAIANHDLYGISVWVADAAHPRRLLERTKLIRFERYAEFTVASLATRRLQLRATGQSPHYDVVYEGSGLEALVTLLAATPHRVRNNLSVDREEH